MKRYFKFHITPKKGWMNDPNGLVYFKGKYHIFYQHYPHDVNWGPMHWGHVVSDDLINFKHADIALYPDMENGCFSGTAIVENNRLYLVYTSFFEKDGEVKQLQSLAYSDDGYTFTKYGLIIDESKLPSEYSVKDFRDPKIYKKDNQYYLLVAAKRKEGNGRIIMFKSNDLYNFEFVSDILDEDCKGIMIECPDYIEKLGLLIYCEQFQPSEGHYHLNIHTNRYHLGHINSNNKFVTTSTGIVDYGFDFYAPQMFADNNVLIAWLSMWDREMHTKKYGYAGVLTIPRKVEIKNNLLYQTPIFDMTDKQVLKQNNNVSIKFSSGVIKIDAKKLYSFEINVKSSKKESYKIYTKDEYIICDRSNTLTPIKGNETNEFSFKGERYMPFIKNERSEIYIVIDEFSVEFFHNGLSLSSLVYNDKKANNVTINMVAKDTLITLYNIKNKKIS